MKKPIIVLDDVTKDYRIRSEWLTPKVVRAVDHVSLDVRFGEILLLTGRSGAGKSTLAQLIVGLTWPTSGDILFDGQVLRRQVGVRELAGRRQIVFQNPYRSLSPRLTAAEIIDEPARIIGRDVNAPALIELVGLPKRVEGQRPRELSAGERQRVALARAMSTDPELIVFDEPTASLDPIAAAGVWDIIDQLRADRAAIVISHDPFTRELADRQIVMEAGCLIDNPASQELVAPQI